jgi:hypothetical protein
MVYRVYPAWATFCVGVSTVGEDGEWQQTHLPVCQTARVVESIFLNVSRTALEFVAAVGVLQDGAITVAIARAPLHRQFHGANGLRDHGLLLPRHGGD